jgi:type I pullulanase
MKLKSVWAGFLSLVLALAGLVVMPLQALAAPTSIDVKVQPLESVSQSDYGNYAIWLWHSGESGKAVPLEQNESGELEATITLPDGTSNIGMLIRRSEGGNEWAYQSQDVTIEPGKNVTVTFTETETSKQWGVDIVADSIDPDPGTDPDPTTHTAEITLHYVRYTGDYDGWNIWTWLPNKDGQSVELQDGTATWTVESAEPISKVGIILRRSTPENEWAEKNSPDDLFITNFEDGKAEVWIAQGDPNVYYSEADVPETPDLSCQELHTKEFNDLYYFDGELGASYTPSSTIFRLWAPTAESVSLVNYSNNGEVIPMTAGEKGTWEYTYEGDANGVQYRYRITFEDGKLDEVPDPYARSSTANSTRSVVVDVDNLNPEGWTSMRMPSFGNPKNATIYEAHVRDLTIGPDNGIENKGKFLGLTEEGTVTAEGNPSGLDYLKSLGVTHVQFLPMYDFATVDETGNLGFDDQYNWGYDPVNYNVPEGSYASDPLDPESRIVDMKAMIDAVHDAGMYVIMDVVYNHVYDVESSPLHRTVPGYYFRYTDGCALHNGTGVGNETASEQPMMRKYMIDSLKYWAEAYQIDGFRFDLMGIHDVETMQQIRSALDEVDSTILLLGEGWNMGNHPDGIEGANQDNATQIPRISFFNDKFRDTMKGTHNKLPGIGYVSGGGADNVAWDVYNLIKGGQHVRGYADAAQSVNYNEAHDNFTMYDKLKGSLPDASEDEIIRRHAFATELQFLSNGVNFVHAGQEAVRTKHGVENSYNSPDHINVLDYDRAAEYADSFAYFQKLAKFRADNDWVRIREYSEIEQAYEALALEDGDKRFSYRVNFGDQPERVVFVNPDADAWQTELPEGDWKLILSDISNTPVTSTEAVNANEDEATYSGAISVPHIAAIVFEKVESEEPTDPSEPTEPSETDPTDSVDPAEPTAPTGEPGDTDRSDKTLPKTGVQVGLLVFAALALAGLGIGAVRLARNR